MIKLIIIFLLMPFVSLAQENNLVCIEDILINAVLENTGNYFQNKNNFFLNLPEINTNSEDAIDWKLSL